MAFDKPKSFIKFAPIALNTIGKKAIKLTTKRLLILNDNSDLQFSQIHFESLNFKTTFNTWWKKEYL